MRLPSLTIALIFVLTCLCHADAQLLYTNNFQSAEIGKVPDDLMVLDGQFAVRDEGGQKFLELPGAPTDTYTVMFGPSTNISLGVSARIYATSKGRRMPAFAVALHGVGGYKLQVSAAKKLIELSKGDQVIQTAPCDWKSGEWATLQLTATKSGTETKLEGKVIQTNATPTVISFVDKEEVAPGKSAISGTPFAGTPIRFDNLAIFATP